MREKLPQCVFVSYSQVDETLASTSEKGKRLLDPLKSYSAENGFPVNILEDNNVSNLAEVHRLEGDLWFCLEGKVEFVVGGELENPWMEKTKDGGENDRELKAQSIKEGISHLLQKGDILWIPAGQPHLHKTTSIARLFIIKIPVREEVPLNSVPGWNK